MKMNRKVVRSVICVLLALIFIVSLMTALIPINASAASQSEINQLTQQRKELQAKQKEQQKTINNLRSKKASVVDQKAALDQENDLAQQEIEVVKQQITAYDQQIEDKGLRNDPQWQDKIIYWGPMGCLTGNYLLMKGDLKPQDILALMQDTFRFVAEYEGEVPGAAPQDCGNYLLHDLPMAKWESAKYLHEVLEQMKEENMKYPEKEEK